MELWNWRELELRERDLFDRFEITKNMAKIVREATRPVLPWYNLIDLAIIGWADGSEARLDIIPVLASRLLYEDFFDFHVMKNHAKQFGISLLNCAKMALQNYLSKTELDTTEELELLDVDEMVNMFNMYPYIKYSDFRSTALDFILEHDITPSEFQVAFVALHGNHTWNDKLWLTFQSDLAVEFFYLLRKVAR